MSKLFNLPDGTSLHLLEVVSVSPICIVDNAKKYSIKMSNKDEILINDSELARSKFVSAFESNNSFWFKLNRVFTHGTWG